MRFWLFTLVIRTRYARSLSYARRPYVLSACWLLLSLRTTPSHYIARQASPGSILVDKRGIQSSSSHRISIKSNKISDTILARCAPYRDSSWAGAQNNPMANIRSHSRGSHRSVLVDSPGAPDISPADTQRLLHTTFTAGSGMDGGSDGHAALSRTQWLR